jgi:hypothetical protein
MFRWNQWQGNDLKMRCVPIKLRRYVACPSSVAKLLRRVDAMPYALLYVDRANFFMDDLNCFQLIFEVLTLIGFSLMGFN